MSELSKTISWVELVTASVKERKIEARGLAQSKFLWEEHLALPLSTNYIGSGERCKLSPRLYLAGREA